MTRNEKMILSLLSKHKNLSKRELQAKGKMSWATAVKMVHRLEDSGFIKESGTQERNYVKGKNAQLYELSTHKPIIVGIDIEYGKTSYVLTNLKGERLRERIIPTPQFREIDNLVLFIQNNLQDFLHKTELDTVFGLGIGIPLFICPTDGNIFTILQKRLEELLQIKVIVDNAMRSYVLERKRKHNISENSIHLIIRSGIGAGIYINNGIYRGDNHLSGEISHFKIEDNNVRCRCGLTGCLETVLNENILFKKYLSIINKYTSDKKEALTDLFKRCSERDSEAYNIVDSAMKQLSKGIIPMLIILDISKVIISGNFGRHGKSLIPLLKREIEKNLPFPRKLHLEYEPISEHSFLYGPAMLISSEFLII